MGDLQQTQAQALTPETMERLIVGGDLSKLTPAQRVEVYLARCEAAGLDPRTQPFAYLSLSGKLTLYATKTATDQLVANRRLSVQIVDRRHMTDAGLYEVIARVTHPDGRIVEDAGVVPISGLRGDSAANAILKAITKAKRRAVLSACGLGMLDETETDAIPGAVVTPAPVLEVTVTPAAPAAPAPSADNQERDRVLAEIGKYWRQLCWSPDTAKANLKAFTGKDRARECSLDELKAYVQRLDAQADASSYEDDDIDAAEFDGEAVPF